MRLWTWQGKGISLTSGEVHHSKSEFFNSRNPKDRELIQAAYRRLIDVLGTDQIIWCLTERYKWFQTKNKPRIEFVLDVPVIEFLEVLDCLSWERIIGNETYYPPKLSEEWESEAIQSINNSSDDSMFDQYVEGRKAEFDEKLSQQDLWDNLFLGYRDLDGLSREYTVLLRHPINPEWIIQK